MHFGLFLESVLLFIAFAVPRYFNYCISTLCFNIWKNQFLERIFSIFKWGRESADRQVTDTTGEGWDLDGRSLKRQGNGFLSPSEELILTRRKDTSDAVRRQRREGLPALPGEITCHFVPDAVTVAGSHVLCSSQAFRTESGRLQQGAISEVDCQPVK